MSAESIILSGAGALGVGSDADFRSEELEQGAQDAERIHKGDESI